MQILNDYNMYFRGQHSMNYNKMNYITDVVVPNHTAQYVTAQSLIQYNTICTNMNNADTRAH